MNRHEELQRNALEHMQAIESLPLKDVSGFGILKSEGNGHIRLYLTLRDSNGEESHVKLQVPYLTGVSLSRAMQHELDHHLIPGGVK